LSFQLFKLWLKNAQFTFMQQLVYPHGNSNCFLGSTYSVLHVGVFV